MPKKIINHNDRSEELKELQAIKKLLARGLQNQGVGVEAIGKALGVSSGRVSQLMARKRYKKHMKKTT